MGLRGPTCYKVSFLMLKNGLEMLENYDIMSGGGEGSAEVQPKAQV